MKRRFPAVVFISWGASRSVRWSAGESAIHPLPIPARRATIAGGKGFREVWASFHKTHKRVGAFRDCLSLAAPTGGTPWYGGALRDFSHTTRPVVATIPGRT